MIEGRPSVTALRAATYRAQHQLFDQPLVFDDPLAVRILAPTGPMKAPRFAALRAFAAARSRFAEDQLVLARAHGCSQYAIIGAGLDTFAYRNSDTDLRVFEIDHPATQAWKRALLAQAGIAVPQGVAYVPVDLAREPLTPALLDAGLDASVPTFFSWLGVTPYLDEAAVLETLAAIHALHPGNRIVFDYLLSARALGLKGRMALRVIEWYVARLGEPLRSGFTPEDIRSRLQAIGFRGVENYDSPALNVLYFDHRSDGLRIPGRMAHFVSASA